MMKKIKKYIHDIKHEVEGGKEYAEKYIELKNVNAQFAGWYHEMALQELLHGEHLRAMGQEYIDKLPFVPEEDKQMWEDSMACCAEQDAVVKLMLSK